MAVFITKAKSNPTFIEGSVNSGSYVDTQNSNDSRLILNDSGGAPANKYKLDFSFDGVSPSDQWGDAIGINELSITSIKIILEAKDTISTNDYYLLMWNFNTSTWDEVGTVMSIGSTETVFTRDIPSNYSDYVGSDELKVRIANGKALGKGGAPNNNSQLEIDYFVVELLNVGIAFDTATNTTGEAGTSHTFSHTTGSGDDRFLIVSVRTQISGGGDVVTGVTYDGTSMTRINTLRSETNNERLYLYQLVNPSAGANNVVISVSSSANIRGAAVSYTGVAQTDPIDVSNSLSQSSGTSISVSVTTTVDNVWLVGVLNVVEGSGSSLVAGSNTTERAGADRQFAHDSNSAQTPTGSKSQNYSWTGNDRNLMLVAAIKPIIAAGLANLKTANTVALANIKTRNGVAIANVKTWNGVS